MKRFIVITYFLLLVQTTITAQNDTLLYFFAGHTYQWYTRGDKVDTRLEDLDLSIYDGIWLGGDVCSEALFEYSTLLYIDSLFDLKHPNTHWTLGNHDTRNGNWIWLEEFTGNKTFYASTYKGISYIILNTCITPYDCEQLNAQYKIIKDVCDTIQSSSHLIIMSHHGLWHKVPGLPISYLNAQSNLIYYNFNCNSTESTFINEIYPRLVEVEERGTDVICMMGDLGASELDFISDDSIQFLGTGLNRSYYKDPVERANSDIDHVLIFEHIPAKKELTWEFVNLDLLSGYQPPNEQ
ncbi:MAG: hypothetical protein PF486_10000 [Prolixibacteraceae bacterium]|jgi:hypothetical protein|nr:hypothetical protein [Prolixibacteraceae bacterium]